MSGTNVGLAGRYVAALEREAHLRRAEPTGRLHTLYIGGGTPSMLEVPLLERICRAVGSEFPEYQHPMETTVELNPEDMTAEWLGELRATVPVNRLSIGLQSTDDELLRLMERRHTGAEAIAAVQRAAVAGFDNISVDLIYALPGQNEARLRDTLDRVLELPVSHVSAYSLMLEPGSKMTLKHMPVADEELSRRHYDLICDRLAAAGMEHYEISNWALPGRRSLHNSGYWASEPYVGLGPAACSYDGLALRRANVGSALRYCKALENGSEFGSEEHLSRQEMFNERVMLGLRTAAGVDLVALRRDFPSAWAAELLRTMSRFSGDVELRGDVLRLTQRGVYVSDMVMAAGMRVDS